MDQAPDDTIWKLLAADLRGAVGESLFDLWLSSLRVAAFDGDALFLSAPDEARAWIEARFGVVLSASAQRVLGAGVTVALTPPAGENDGGEPAGIPAPPAPPELRLNPRYTFEQFVIGPGNRLAHGAALAVAENPGTAYNPLFLCGPPGVGKTHLLHSIGNYVSEFAPGMRVRSTTAEAFANDFIGALRAKRIESFKSRYRQNDVLLIDDVQFLMSKARTEEEFFHTFNALRDAGAQLVLTSDRVPRDLDGIHERLRDRFESGLVTRVDAPDDRTRMTVLRKRAVEDGIDVTDDVLAVIATRATTNLRALEGALIRVIAYASLRGRPLTPELADEVLGDLFPQPRAGTGTRTVTIADVQSATCEAFGLSRDELLSSSRAARVSWPRQVAMYLAREHTGASLPAIGAEFGGRSHTTVMHACRRATQRLGDDPEASSLVELLSRRLSTTSPAPSTDRPG